MPLYEYLCDGCSHRFERIRRFSDPPVEACPRCGGQVHKVQSAPAFQFKGSGWYITDYAKKAEASKSDEAPKGETAGKDAPATSAGKEGDSATSTRTESKGSEAKAGESKPAASTSGPKDTLPKP